MVFGAPVRDQIKSEAQSNGEGKRRHFREGFSSVAGNSIISPGETYEDQSVPFRQKRSRNRNIKSRKFYNSMSKLDKINAITDQANGLEDQISLNFIRIEGGGLIDDGDFILGHNGNYYKPQRRRSGKASIIFLSPVGQQDGGESQSIQRIDDAQQSHVQTYKSNSNIDT